MNDQDKSLIERYLRQDLAEAERAAFELRLAGDADLREEVLLYKRTLTAIDLYAKDDFKKKLRAHRSTAGHRNGKTFWLLLGVLLCLGAFWVWGPWNSPDAPPVQPPVPSPLPPATDTSAPSVKTPVARETPATEKNAQPNPQQLFARLYKPYQPAAEDGAVHGANPGPAAPATLQDLERCLREGRYADARAAFDQLPPAIRENLNALFLKANAEMALGHTATAAPFFEKVAASPANLYAGEARWYLALIALKQGDVPTARKWLRMVRDDQGCAPARRAAAAQALKQLK